MKGGLGVAVVRGYEVIFLLHHFVKGASTEEYLRGREEKEKGKGAHRRAGIGTIKQTTSMGSVSEQKKKYKR